MVRLFRSNETDFTHNDWVLNEIISCKVIDELNGDFTSELEYPLEDSKNISSNLVVGAIASIPTIDNRVDQLFRIIKVDKTERTVVVQLQAKLLADLKANWCRPMTIIDKTRKQAIEQILNSCLDKHIYKVGNLDINTNTNVVINTEAGNPLTYIISDNDNSLIKNYGGEFIVNNNTIDIISNRGSNNGVIIEYGKNIVGITESINDTDLATILVPKSGDIYLPEYFIESTNVSKYEKRYFKEVEFNLDIWDGESEKGEDQITLEEAYMLMRKVCNEMFTVDKVDQLTFNYSIDFIELSKTEEYKNFKALETVNVGDIVTIKHKKLNLNLEGRVNKIEYSIDSEGLSEIDNIEIGFSKKDLTDIINSTIRQIQFAEQNILLKVSNLDNTLTSKIEITANEIRSEVADTKEDLQGQLNIQSNKINAVVSEKGEGMGWELSKSAFKVACVGASGASVTIDENGQTIDDGKFKIKKNGSTVFYVNKRGTCTADGGFRVYDNDTSTELNSDGLVITNSNGYEGILQAYNRSNTLYTPRDFHIGEDLFVAGHTVIDDWCDIDTDLWVGGDLDVSGEKNCLQNTKNYGSRRINAYETAEYYFGDIGEGIIKDGECIIYIDDIFAECINTDVSYQADIFEYKNRGSITDIERHPNYFIVKGNVDDIEFGWEIKAKRKGYENNRLECKLDKNDTSTYELENILLENKNTNLEGILLEEVL